MTKAFLSTWLLLASIATAADVPQPQHVRNFGQVNDHLLRGATPSEEALRELKALGVSMILDLRQDGPGRDHEQQLAQQLGMRYTHLPLRSVGAPTPAEIEQALSLLLQQTSAKIYVHCMRGKDRTGTVIACYRIQHDGWDNRRALNEAKGFGMSSLEWAMQSFILHFTPVTLPSLANPAN
jgi:tyrosine-protein phosphatase SIW14